MRIVRDSFTQSSFMPANSLSAGANALSMSASGVGPVRAAIRSIMLSEFEAFVRGLLYSDEPSIRERLRAFALDRGARVI